MRSKQIGLLVLTAMLLVGCSRGGVENNPAVETTPEAVHTPAPTAELSRPGVTILADGVVQAARPALSLAFQATGKLTTVAVQAGDVVKPGDLIARLDDASVQEQVTQAQLSLNLAELTLIELNREADPADVASARANLASAQANLASVTDRPDDPQLEASRQNLSSAQQALQDLLALPDTNQVQIAKANLATVELQLRSAQAAYDQVAYADNVGMSPQAMNLQEATLNFERAQAEFNQAVKGPSEGDLAAARTRVAQAQSELDTLLKAPDPKALDAAIAQVDQAQAALDKLIAGASAKDMTTAEINVAQAQLTLEGALRSLDNLTLVAPASGTVTAVEVTPGALVTAGAPVVTIRDMRNLEFWTTNVSERDLAQIIPGQRAIVTLKAFPDDPISATVARIGSQAGVPVGDAATFPVIINLPKIELVIWPEMTGRVEIQTE